MFKYILFWFQYFRICTIDKDLFRIPPEKIYKGLCLGVSLDVYYPGFPTLKHLPHTVNTGLMLNRNLRSKLSRIEIMAF